MVLFERGVLAVPGKATSNLNIITANSGEDSLLLRIQSFGSLADTRRSILWLNLLATGVMLPADLFMSAARFPTGFHGRGRHIFLWPSPHGSWREPCIVLFFNFARLWKVIIRIVLDIVRDDELLGENWLRATSLSFDRISCEPLHAHVTRRIFDRMLEKVGAVFHRARRLEQFASASDAVYRRSAAQSQSELFTSACPDGGIARELGGQDIESVGWDYSLETHTQWLRCCDSSLRRQRTFSGGMSTSAIGVPGRNVPHYGTPWPRLASLTRRIHAMKWVRITRKFVWLTVSTIHLTRR